MTNRRLPLEGWVRNLVRPDCNGPLAISLGPMNTARGWVVQTTEPTRTMHSTHTLSRRSTRMRLAVLLSVLTSAACIAGAEAQDPAPDSASMRPRQRPASDAPATPAQPRLTAAQVAGLVQSFYDQTTSFQANFEQEQYTKVYDRRQRSSGRVVFAKPGRMRFDFETIEIWRVGDDGKIDPVRLGRWIGLQCGRRVDGRWFERVGVRQGLLRWAIRTA